LRRWIGISACALLLLAIDASPARADLTAFVGGQTNPSTRLTKGVSAGSGFLVVGFEGEYAQANGDDVCPSASSNADCAPSVRTVMFNGLVQTPRGVIPKLQLYATAGGGYFRVRFESLGIQDTGFGTNVGGGVKITLAGPLRVRLDYRVFKLTEALEKGGYNPTAQRVYVGVNLAF
jgi:opacity protein-like surface antigen